MAEGEKPPHERSNDVETEEEATESVKLFVGQVPKHMTESQLLSLFSDFALVDQVNIIRDKATRASRGCCFLICPSREEADKVIDACHNKQTLPGASSPLQVKYADGELERLEHKLFIGMLPKNITEAEVYDLFSTYGTINDLQILRGSQQTSRGCAFLKYETKEQALASIEAINGKHKMEIPRRNARLGKLRKLKHLFLGLKVQIHRIIHHYSELYPWEYAPPYNGYGYQASGTYGLMPYRLPHSQAAYASMMSPLNRGSALRRFPPDLAPGLPPRNFRIPSGAYVPSVFPPVPNLQLPLAYRGGVAGQGNLSDSPNSLHHSPLFSNSALSTGVRTSSGSQAEGPPGANLFIYQIPQEFGDQELANAFQSFGRVLSAKVFVDKATGISKCFGFVSYDSPTSAQNAINVMNGYELGGKKLKVQLKRENKLY
ncbi:unnamed protein product [Rhodiola kirilowii]